MTKDEARRIHAANQEISISLSLGLNQLKGSANIAVAAALRDFNDRILAPFFNEHRALICGRY